MDVERSRALYVCEKLQPVLGVLSAATAEQLNDAPKDLDAALLGALYRYKGETRLQRAEARKAQLEARLAALQAQCAEPDHLRRALADAFPWTGAVPGPLAKLRLQRGQEVPAGILCVVEKGTVLSYVGDEQVGACSTGHCFQTGQYIFEAADACVLWTLPDSQARVEHAKTAEAEARVRRLVLACPFFNGLEPSKLDWVIGAMQEKQIPPRTQVISQGDEGNSLFLLEKGTLVVLQHTDGDPECVATVRPGGVCGELALLEADTRQASVETGRSACTVWELDRETFQQTVLPVARERRQRLAPAFAAVPLFAELSAWDQATIADACELEAFQKDDQVAQDGKLSILLKGEVQRSEQDCYRAGDVLGDVSLLLELVGVQCSEPMKGLALSGGQVATLSRANCHVLRSVQGLGFQLSNLLRSPTPGQ